MAKTPPFQIITASDLVEGDVIYQTADSSWSRSLSDAEVISDGTQADLRLQTAAKQINTLVGAYLVGVPSDVTNRDDLHFREAFRAKGPSNYSHGKQEVGQDV